MWWHQPINGWARTCKMDVRMESTPCIQDIQNATGMQRPKCILRMHAFCSRQPNIFIFEGKCYLENPPLLSLKFQFQTQLIGVFTPVTYRVVKIMCFCSEIVLRTIKNYKAYYSYPGLGPCYEVIVLRPAFLLLKRMNNVTMGVS
jgi:hypothetical protein